MILVRACHGFDELQACVDMEIDVWGYNDGDVIPRRVLLVAQKIGGQVIGAFDTSIPGASEHGDAASLVGFAFSLPGIKARKGSAGEETESYLHSHMLAVKESYRNQGLGARLKLAQRDEALARGIRRMEWTFDPLEIKNAFLNIHKLGAVVRRYEENFYGVSSSRLQGGLQTDRLVAEWWLESPRVIGALRSQSRELSGSDTYPLDPQVIRVPAAIYQWKSDDASRHLAREVQAENRHRFQQAFSEGAAIVAFTRNHNGDGIYHLGAWAEPKSTSILNQNALEAEPSRT